MKKINPKFIIFAVLFLFLIITPPALNQYYNYLLESPQPLAAKVQKIFVISPGEPIKEITASLKREGLIKNELAFRLFVTQLGIGKNIQAGDFRLSPAMSAKDIALSLTHGAIDVWITLPEGLRKEEQAERISQKLQLGSNPSFNFDKKEYIKNAREGYMFPDTYLIPKDSTTAGIEQKLTATFSQKVDESILKNGAKINLTEEDVVILASLIEKEAKTDAEKPTIAGILLNRIKIGMALQVDATVSYAKGFDSSQNTWWPQVTVDEYHSIKSPYNTYLVTGLPPAPICSPGLASIRAAANPNATDYLYYLHDSSGQIHYAKTAAEHQGNIQKYL